MFAVSENEINELVKKELDKAMEKWGKHNSHHEKYAVIKEEFEEAKGDFECIGLGLDIFWDDIKRNYKTDKDILLMRGRAMECIQELIQVMAMIDKEVK